MKKGFISGILILLMAACSRETVKLSSETTSQTRGDSKYDYLLSEAIRLKYLGEPGQSVALFEKCIETDKNRAVPYFELAQVYAATGDSDKALRYSSAAANLDKSNYWYQLACGSLFVQYEKKDSAIVYFKRALKADPKAVEVNSVLAGLYSEMGDNARADSLFVILDRAGALNEQMFLAMISGLVEGKKYSEAADRTVSLINRFPGEIRYRALLANIYSEAGDSEKSDSIYTSIIEEDPENAESQLLVMVNLLNKKDYEGTAAFLGSVVKSNSIERERKVALINELAADSAFVESQGQALEIDILALEAIFPDDEEVMSIRPGLYEREGRNDMAITRYEEILKTVKPGYFFKERLILLYAEEGDYEKLYTLASGYATENNRSILGKVYFAVAAMELKKYDIADAELKKALILVGNDNGLKMQVLSMLGDLKYRTKDFEESYRYLEEALEIDPEDIMLLNNYAYFLAENDRELPKALKMSEKTIAKEGGNATYLDTYAWVLYKSGKYKEAYKVMLKIFDTSKKNDPEIQEHMGYILMKLSRCDEAVEYWKMALNSDSSKEYLKKEIELCGGLLSE
jgi:tetratricopeptide (TPR) repeat protein